MLHSVPGFSTKESVTEISGRGVGMDAVKTAVEKLGERSGYIPRRESTRKSELICLPQLL